MIGKSDRRRSDHSVKCGICRAEIEDRAQIFQSGINLGVVCEDCYKRFSAEDLEMMGNMFIAYGGYFGMRKDSKFSVIKILEKVLQDTLEEGNKVDSEKINIRLMHMALLHGVTPEQYIKNLNLLIDD